MKTNDNQSKRIYDKTTKQWYEIPEDQYRGTTAGAPPSQKDAVSRRVLLPAQQVVVVRRQLPRLRIPQQHDRPLDDPLPDGEGTLADYVRTTLLLLKRCWPKAN